MRTAVLAASVLALSSSRDDVAPTESRLTAEQLEQMVTPDSRMSLDPTGE